MAETVSAVATYAHRAPRAVSTRANKSLYRDDEVLADFFKVLKWSLIPILCFTAVWLFEMYMLESPRRLVPNPAEFATRIFGFSHYVVGMVFMMSSKKMRKVEGWGWFAGLLAVGVVISVLFHNFGGRANPVMVIFYFLFFMAHGFRDVIFFYKPSTDDPELERMRSKALWLIQACLLISLMYVLVPAFLFYRSLRPKTYTPELKAQIDAMMPYLWAVLSWSWLLLPICLIGLRRHLRKFPEGPAGFWRDNKPILLVLIYSTLIILGSPLLGFWIYNFLIMSHFVGWYFYAGRRLARVPKQTTRRDGWWKWFRGSVAGFERLHLSMAAIFFVILLLNYFFLFDRGIVNTLFSANAFYYWTMIHVAVSFAPRS